MKRDFTLSKYQELLKCFPAGDYSVEGAIFNLRQIAIIRHDVDRRPNNVVELATIEHDYNIRSTYYFRVKKNLFIPNVIEKVKSLGHEIGYHYEVLDKAKGNFEKAKEILKNEWVLFQKWDAKTVAAHGNPMTKFNNLDMWDKYDYDELGIIGEAHKSIIPLNYNYVSDTGRKWNLCFSKEKKIDLFNITIKNTSKLIDLIRNNEISRIYLLVHPSRWNDDYILWLKEILFQNIKNPIKKTLRIIRQ